MHERRAVWCGLGKRASATKWPCFRDLLGYACAGLGAYITTWVRTVGRGASGGVTFFSWSYDTVAPHTSAHMHSHSALQLTTAAGLHMEIHAGKNSFGSHSSVGSTTSLPHTDPQ